MNHRRAFSLLGPAVLVFGHGAPVQAGGVSRVLERLPMRFEANEGQLDRRVRYYSRAPGYTLFLTPEEAVLSWSSGASSEVLRISLPNANREPQIEGIDSLASRSNYFLGKRREAWRTNVRQYERVRYRGVYPGIDLIFYGNGRQLEYDFVVKPGVDPQRIRMKFSGAEKISLDKSGALVVRVGGKELRQLQPVAYQESRGAVEAHYVLLGRGEVGFCVGEYDPNKTLVIDPVLSYSTLLGGGSLDVARVVAVEASGNIWVAGHTWSTDFPVAGAAYRDYPAGSQDIFLAKLNPSLAGADSLSYSAYLGGSGDDEPRAMCLDASGGLYLAGVTSSSDFPMAGNSAQSASGGGQDAFVAKFYPEIPWGDALAYSTYLGGSGTDAANAVAVDAAGNIYVAGYTTPAENFPLTADTLQGGSQGGWEAFAAKLDPAAASAADSLRYSTYLGGSSTDVATAVGVAGAGKIYIAGYTMSDNFPVSDRPYRDFMIGGGDVFLTELDLSKPHLDALVYSTYLGGSGLDVPLSMVLDGSGGIWLAGYTLSRDFPVSDSGPQPEYAGTGDGFVARMNLALPRAESLTYATYLGGRGSDVAYGMALEGSGKIFLAGYTTSDDFPTTRGAVQGAYGGGAADAFVAVVDPAASGADALIYGSYLGGSFTDVAHGIALDAGGNVYLAGYTQSASFPVTEGAFQAALNGFSDAFVIMLNLAP